MCKKPGCHWGWSEPRPTGNFVSATAAKRDVTLEEWVRKGGTLNGKKMIHSDHPVKRLLGHDFGHSQEASEVQWLLLPSSVYLSFFLSLFHFILLLGPSIPHSQFHWIPPSLFASPSSCHCSSCSLSEYTLLVPGISLSSVPPFISFLLLHLTFLLLLLSSFLAVGRFFWDPLISLTHPKIGLHQTTCTDNS